jgi:hypothetical protein
VIWETAEDGFVFHDLRHTFNTYMRKAGVAESVIMEITGHSTWEMFDRYNTVNHDGRRHAIDQYGALLRNFDQPLDQEPLEQQNKGVGLSGEPLDFVLVPKRGLEPRQAYAH